MGGGGGGGVLSPVAAHENRVDEECDRRGEEEQIR